MQPDILAATSRLFSSSVLQELARRGMSPSFTRLSRESQLFDLVSPDAAVSDVFDAALKALKTGANRNEYVYKSALTQNILLGKHSLQTASMLTEFRVADCKADLVIFNGTATAYEIKSERDSLARLGRQVEAYREVFAKVYVIVGENHLSSVAHDLPGDVGIMVLSKRQHISVCKDAVSQPERTKPEAIFDSLRLHEAKLILRSYGYEIPQAPNSEMYAVLRNLFLKLSPEAAHAGMVKVLKKTRSLKPMIGLLNELPGSLHSAALTVPLRRADHVRLVKAVSTPIFAAQTWA